MFEIAGFQIVQPPTIDHMVYLGFILKKPDFFSMVLVLDCNLR